MRVVNIWLNFQNRNKKKLQNKMNFSQFSKQVYGDHTYCYGHRVTMSEGFIYIDGAKTDFTELEEARKYIKQENISNNLEEEISKQIYEELSDTKIASIIKEKHKIKVTNTLIENYKTLASSNAFTIDPVVIEIRKLNNIDTLVENKMHFSLDDSSVIAISEDSIDKLNKLKDKEVLVAFMKESVDNFIKVIEILED